MVESNWALADAIALAVLANHGGVARIGAFLAAGLTRHQVAAIVRRGVLERPREAWYVDPALSWQAKHAIRVGGVLACVSAAAAYGLPVPPGSHGLLHVHVPANSPRRRHNRDRTWYVAPGEDPEVQLHWSKPSVAVEAWRVGLLDALVQLADCVLADWFVAALDAATHRPRTGEDPLLPPGGLDRMRELLPLRMQAALALVDPLSESPIETLLRLGMIRRGIGPVILQFSPRPRMFVDFLVGNRLVVEADGEAFHDPAKDAVRDALLTALGYRVLRFSYARIVDDLNAVLDEIEAALAVL